MLLLLCALGRELDFRLLEDRIWHESAIVELVVWERGRCGVVGAGWGLEGVDGCSDGLWCFHEWKREKKPGASGVEGGGSRPEIGEAGEDDDGVEEEEDF